MIINFKSFLISVALLFSVGLSAQEDSLLTFKMVFVGDVMQHKPQIESAKLSGNKGYNFDSCFKYVRPIIEKADLAIGNLEVTLPGKPPYKGYPQFRSPDALAKGLKYAGFDVMVTANNHSNDAGRTGVINTIQTLKDFGFYQTGTFKNTSERELFYPLIIHKNNFKFAFLNYTYGTNGIRTKAPTIVNYIDTVQMKKDLELAIRSQSDAIIVLMHWGKEYKLNESKKQQKLAEWLIENGADLVMGAHPHVVQPIKEYQKSGTDAKKLIAYSMGNFISNQTKPNTDGGIMVEVNFEKDLRNKQTSLTEHYYIPVWRYIKKDRKNRRQYFALPVKTFEKGKVRLGKSDREKIKDFAKKTRTHLNKWSGKEREID